MCSIVFFFLLSFFNLQQQQLIIVLHLSVFFPYFRVNTFKSRGGLVALNLKNVVFSCVFLKEKGKFKILKQKNEKKIQQLISRMAACQQLTMVMPKTNSCCCGASPASCCKML